MTEIGVDQITPIISQHSERKILKIERMERIISSAVSQSFNAYAPRLSAPISFHDFIANNTFEQQFIAHCHKGYGGISHLKTMALPNKNIAVLIGPEGDFSQQEVDLAIQNNWQHTGLGTSRLRSETAALTACIALNLINE